jgi:hypothetical protein
MHGNSFRLQRLGQRRFGLVVAAHAVPIGFKPTRQRRHADAANTEEKYVRKLLHRF